MSYDLHVYCAAQPTWVDTPASGKGWLINCFGDELKDEDLPPEVAGVLPGLSHRVSFSLQPSTAPAAAKTQLTKLAKALAKEMDGLVFDPQTGVIAVKRKRFVPTPKPKDEPVSIVQLSWFFLGKQSLRADLVRNLFDIFERDLPEALPRRYGFSEPPQFELEKMGRPHAIEFASNYVSSIPMVWYAHAPVAYVFLSLANQRDDDAHKNKQSGAGWIRLGGAYEYRCDRLTINLFADCLNQRGWQTSLERLFQKVAVLLDVFYADVRKMGGYFKRGRGYSSGARTEEHPVRAGWWTGIPERSSQAMIVGSPYLELWPELQKYERGGLANVSVSDWTAGDLRDVLTVPTQLIGPGPVEGYGGSNGTYVDRKTRYATVFPFGDRPGRKPTVSVAERRLPAGVRRRK